MSMWDGYPGKWLADHLEAGGVLALETFGLAADAEAARPSPGPRFPRAVLEAAFAGAEWLDTVRFEKPMRLAVASHRREFDVRIVGGGARRCRGAARYPTFGIELAPPVSALLRSEGVVEPMAVLALRPGESAEGLRGHLWIGRDSREDADLEEPFDIGDWDPWQSPRILSWTL